MTKNVGLIVLGQEFPSVGIVEAEYVISKVFQHDKLKRLVRPDPSKLAEAIGKLQSEYSEILIINGMVNLRHFEDLFQSIQNQATALESSLTKLNENWSAYYYFNANQPDGVDSNLVELEHELANVLDQIIRRARHALAAVLTEQESELGFSQYWIEHSEKSATSWLWRSGYPDVFKEHFGVRYAIPESDEGTSPGFRFALAVQKVAGLPFTSHSTLRAHLNGKRRGRRSTLGRDTTKVALIVPR